MNDVREVVDVEQVMERIRENLKRRRPPADGQSSDNHVTPLDEGQAAADFAYVHSGHDIRDFPLTSRRRVLGPLLVLTRRILRKLVAPFLERQVAYNAANTRLTRVLKEWIGSLDDAQARLRKEVRALGPHLREELLAVESRLREEVQAVESRLREEVQAVESRLREEFAAQTGKVLAGEAQLQQDIRAVGTHSGEALAAQAQELRVTREALIVDQSRLAREMAAQSQALQAVRERTSLAERKFRRILHAFDVDPRRPNLPEAKTGAPPAAPLPALAPAFDYAGLEERFRGSEEEIKERQRIYVPYFAGRQPILDIGCGRGEFLERLRASGTVARGVDADLDMVLLCRDKGLDVVMDDVFRYLDGVADDSVGGIFAAQVIEHFPSPRVIDLLTLCHRKLTPAGVLVVETPNPKCLFVFAETFYKDPSHVQPVHPETLQFLCEATGFHEVELKFLSPVDPLLRIPSLDVPGVALDPFNHGIERLNSLLFGFQDYAVIARKRT